MVLIYFFFYILNILDKIYPLLIQEGFFKCLLFLFSVNNIQIQSKCFEIINLFISNNKLFQIS